MRVSTLTCHWHDPRALSERRGNARLDRCGQERLGVGWQRAAEGLATRGIELREHIVQEKDRRFAGAGTDPLRLGELEREDRRALFTA